MNYAQKYNELKTLLLSDATTNQLSSQLSSSVLTLDVRVRNQALDHQNGYFQLLRLCAEEVVSADIAAFIFNAGYAINSEEGSLSTRVLLTYLFNTATPNVLANKIKEVEFVYHPISVKEYVYVMMNEKMVGQRVTLLDQLKTIKQFHVEVDESIIQDYFKEAIMLYKTGDADKRRVLRAILDKIVTLIHKVAELKRAVTSGQPVLLDAQAIEKLGTQLKEQIEATFPVTQEPVCFSRFLGISLIVVGALLVTAGIFTIVGAPFSMFGMGLMSAGFMTASSMPFAGSLVTSLGVGSMLVGLYKLVHRARNEVPLVPVVNALVESGKRNAATLFKANKPVEHSKPAPHTVSPYLTIHRT